MPECRELRQTIGCRRQFGALPELSRAGPAAHGGHTAGEAARSFELLFKVITMPNTFVAEPPLTNDFRRIKGSLHARLLEEIDIDSMNRLSETVARERVRETVREMLSRE